jgi:hypothetical protein
MFPRLDMKKWAKAYTDMLWLAEMYCNTVKDNPKNEKAKRALQAVTDSLDTNKDVLSELSFAMGRFESARELNIKLAEHIKLLAYRLQQAQEEKEGVMATVHELREEIKRIEEMSSIEETGQSLSEKQVEKYNTK